MTLETLVGLKVVDDAAYRSYRKEMTPLLKSFGGDFGYDFKIAEVLKSRTDAPINRVFTIYFPDQAAKDAFFSNEAYVAIKEKYFDKAVAHTTTLATYER